MRLNQENVYGIKLVEYLANLEGEKTIVAGGYRLKKEEVSIYEIVKALNGELYITNDLKEKKEPEGEIEMELKKIQEDIIARVKNLKIKKKN